MRPRLRLIKTSSPCLLALACEDVAVFADFYDAYYDRVLGFIARRVFDPELAIDLVSETFATALERRRQFRGERPEQEQAWLFAIARTAVSHFWRSGRVERAAITRYAITVPTLSEAEHERIEALAGLTALGEDLAVALAALPDDQRRAVELRVLDELTYTELATVLEVTEATARARVSRGLRALARAMPERNANLIGDTA